MKYYFDHYCTFYTFYFYNFSDPSFFFLGNQDVDAIYETQDDDLSGRVMCHQNQQLNIW